jgi:predicted amidohydrolase
MESAKRVAENAVEKNAEVILFPEYFSYSSLSLKISEETLRFLRDLSREYRITVSGNAVVEDEGLYNRAFVFNDGELEGFQDKIHPTRTEREMGLKCGRKLDVFEVNGVKLCILVCADILYPEICRVAAIKGAEIALNPVVSFKTSELPGEEYRYCLYFTRSFDNCYGIVKAGGFGYTFTGSRAVGRSLIATFDGVVARARDEDREEAVVGKIDIERIRKYREINYSLRERNVRAYRDLLDSSFDC